MSGDPKEDLIAAKRKQIRNNFLDNPCFICEAQKETHELPQKMAQAISEQDKNAVFFQTYSLLVRIYINTTKGTAAHQYARDKLAQVSKLDLLKYTVNEVESAFQEKRNEYKEAIFIGESDIGEPTCDTPLLRAAKADILLENIHELRDVLAGRYCDNEFLVKKSLVSEGQGSLFDPMCN